MTREVSRDAIRASMPELEWISDRGLRDKVVEAWAMALASSSFDALEDVPGEYDIEPSIDQLTHQRGVASLGRSIAEGMRAVVPLDVDLDVVVAGALVHDVGKAYEYDPERAAAWRARPQRAGYPPIRHPVYGVHIALSVGLPEEVAHICGAHAREGELVQRSLEGTIVTHADTLFWELVAKDRHGLRVQDRVRMAMPADGLRPLPIRAREARS